MPLVLWHFTSALLGKMVWVSDALGLAFSGAGSLSPSTSILWWCSSAIYCESPTTFEVTSATDSHSAMVHSRSRSWWSATTVIKTISSSKLVDGASSILKLPQQMWKTVPLILRILHSYHSWSFRLKRWVPFPTSKTSKTRFSCDCSDISHGCVGWGGRILLVQIPWCLCRRGALTWLSVVIFEVSVRCQFFLVYVIRIPT